MSNPNDAQLPTAPRRRGRPPLKRTLEQKATSAPLSIAQPVAMPRLLTVKGWCQWMSLSPSSSYKLVAAKKLRVVKVGERTLVDTESTLAWLKTLPNIAGGDEA